MLSNNLKILIIKNLLFTLLVPGTVAVAIPLLIIDGTEIQAGILSIPGVFLLLLGLAVYGWCVWDFAVTGFGTPAPIAAPKHLVRCGLYQYTRNPMYVGVLSVIFGWSLLYSDLDVFLYGLGMAICFQLFVVFYEEPLLTKLFADEYEKYSTSVNRWFPHR